MPTPARSETILKRYSPTEDQPWSFRRVVHLHRRAGFAATWNEIQRDLKDGPQAAVDRLIKGESRIDGVPDAFEQMATVIGDAAVGSGNVNRLKAWWLYRMLFTPDPLTERLVLMWHNHFATSNAKVNDLPAMRQQNELFRKLARAPFGELLDRAVRDPALLIWLDAPANRKGHPNENLARELMELFTLGIGHYAETDVREAARALTGWTIKDRAFREKPEDHDTDEKTILGHIGRWNGTDLVRFLLEHPATSHRLATRICGLFMGEGANDAAAVDALASGLREHNLDIGWAVETVLRSQAFHADTNIGNRVVGPAEFVVGAARALELFDPIPSTLILADWTKLLGQDLFYPPNVGGWNEGRSWLTSRTLVGRTNFAAALVDGGLWTRAGPFDALGLAARHNKGSDAQNAITFFAELLIGTDLGSSSQDSLVVAPNEQTNSEAETARRVVAMILASSKAQLS